MAKTNRFLASLLFLIIFAYFYSSSNEKKSNDQSFSVQLTGNSIESHVLLIYVYANTHSYALGNLKYFIDNAVGENDGVDYYFILQQVEKKTINENEMPPLKVTNAHYIQHENLCFDFGTYGWFLNEFTYGNPWTKDKQNAKKKINLQKYKYFIFMNSSIRGPFFPPYFLQLVLQNKLNNYYWYSIFTRKLNEQVKLVGPTISCETVPHVQTYLFATDFVGLKILLQPGRHGATSDEGIFGCYPTKDHATINSELPSSNRILGAGYGIDSLLTKYQRVNFSSPTNLWCNQNKNPYKDKLFDGTSLEPYEVVFVKYNDLPFLVEARDKAKLYQKWAQDAKSLNRTAW